MNIDEVEAKLISEFDKLSTWEEKYKKIIDIGKTLEAYPEEFRKDDLKVKGCQSQVWLHAELMPNGLIRFQADSDALIVKGLVAVVLKVYSGQNPEFILKHEPKFIQKMGFSENLSASRANGLLAMIKQIKFYAMAFSMMKK